MNSLDTTPSQRFRLEQWQPWQEALCQRILDRRK